MKLALFTDIHGNFPAFEAALSHAKSQGADSFVVAGDAVTDYPGSAQILDLIRMEGMQMVCGNRETYCLNYRADDKKREEAFLYPQNQPLKWTYDHLTEDHFAFMASLPRELVIELGGKTMRVCHHSPGKRYWHLHPMKDESNVASVMEMLKEDILFVGHHHEAAVKQYGEKLFFNPGSIGVNWSGPFAADYGLLDTADGILKYSLHHVPYDGDALLHCCEQSGLMDDPASRFWTLLNLRMQTGGQEVFDTFFALAADLKKQAGCYDAHIPQEIWREAVRMHCKKWNIRL